MGCILLVLYEVVIDGAVFPHEAKNNKIFAIVQRYAILRMLFTLNGWVVF